MKRKRTVWIIVGILGAIGCLVLCAAGYLVYSIGSASYGIMKGAALVGNPAADFSLPTLDQETIKLSDLRDKPVIISFSTTWCPDCAREAPLLQQMHETYPDVTVLWVDSKEDPALVKKYMADAHYTFQAVLDQDGKIAQQYQVFAVPTVYFIDTNGIIQARFVENMTLEDLQNALPRVGIEP